MARPLTVVAAMVLVACGLIIGCADAPTAPTPTEPNAPDPPSRGGPSSNLTRWLSVTGGAGTGIWRTDSTPAEGGGPAITNWEANRSVINGGTSDVSLTTAWEVASIILSETGTGSGYYEVPASSGTRQTLTLSLAQDVPVNSVRLSLAGKDTSGSVGRYHDVTFDVVEVGTGDLQVTLSWNVDSDVDLHVVDPSGEEIFWSDKTSLDYS